MGISLYPFAGISSIFEEKTAMEIQAESRNDSFKKISIILKIATLGVAFIAIAMMAL